MYDAKYYTPGMIREKHIQHTQTIDISSLKLSILGGWDNELY